MNELALFAGSGGGLLASQYLLGWRCVCAVEREAYRQANLLARQADGLLLPFPIWSDVRTFDGRPWRGLVDVVTGGFPCQPWSVAGKRQGQADDRNLWPDTKRIIREVGSEFVFLENVPNLLAHRYFGRILADLAALGYRVTWDCIPASAVGANHQRDRLWILAHNANADKFSPDGRGFHPGGVPFEQTPDLQGRALSNADRRRREERLQEGRRLHKSDPLRADVPDAGDDRLGFRDDQQKPKSGSGIKADAGDDGTEGSLADADRRGRRKAQSGGPTQGRQSHTDLGGSLPHTDGDGRDAGGLPVRPGRQDEEEAVPPGTGEKLPHTPTPGLQGDRTIARVQVPGSPPEPGSWRWATYWWEVEPDVGRVVDGLADRLDLT